MKRSGSKLIAKAGSVKNISKAGYRFDVSLAMESVDNMLGTSDVVCTWERGPKVLSTPPCKINKHKRTVDFDGAAMRQEITLFKKKKSDAGFEPKVFRLAVRQGSETGRVVGKIDLNFADYADLPSFSKRIGAPLSSGGRLILRVETRYLGEAEKKRGKKKGAKSDDDASSMYSDSTLADDKLSTAAAEELAERDKDEQDLDDLDVTAGGGAAPSRDPPPRARKAPSRDVPSGTGGGGGDDGPSVRADDGPAARRAASKDARAGRDGGMGSRAASRDPPRAPARKAPSRDVAAGGGRDAWEERRGGGDDGGGASRSEVERIRADNKLLRRENDQLRERLAESGGGGGGGQEEEVRALTQENANLRRDIEELEARISREPVYADVVRDLRESKMALAILTMERDELQQAVRTNSGVGGGGSSGGGKGAIAGRNLL